jgi:hypothetical protein
MLSGDINAGPRGAIVPFVVVGCVLLVSGKGVSIVAKRVLIYMVFVFEWVGGFGSVGMSNAGEVEKAQTARGCAQERWIGEGGCG